MADVLVSPDSTIAAQQLATEQAKIRENEWLTPDAKAWHMRRLERAFADAQHSHTLSRPARIIWIILSLPAVLLDIVSDLPNIIQYGLYGGRGFGHGQDARGQGHLQHTAPLAIIEDRPRQATQEREHQD
ncbi:MAG: hypothetical protein M1835_006448 [Candelina submexicana]|nr:MAG: hypothetical protein M1835_006448 [Candelina submexicana]